MNFKVSQLKSLTAGEVAVDDLIYVIDSNPTDGSVKSKKVTVGDLIDSRIYGISSSQFVLITGYYADPSWITSLDWSKITNAPSFVTSLSALTDVQLSTPLSGQALVYNGTKWVNQGIGELDTLNSVTTRGNTTTNAITVGGLTVDTDTLVVDSVNNRVGIGTTSPAYNLQILDTTSGVPQQLDIKNTTAAARAAFTLTNNVGNSFYMQIAGSSYASTALRNVAAIASQGASVDSFWIATNWEIGSGGSVPIKFVTGGYNNTPTMMITAGSTGNVLIGTTTDAGYKLDVNGSLRTTGILYSNNNLAVGNYDSIISPSGSVNLSVYSDTSFTPGRIVLGGSAASGPTVNGIISFANNRLNSFYPGQFEQAKIESYFAPNGQTGGDLRFYTRTYTDFGERLRITDSGNILINTTTDSGYKLDVNGTARIQGNTEISRSGSDTQLTIARGGGASLTLQAKANTTSSSEGVNLYWTANTWLKFVLGSSVVANFSNVGNLLVGTSTDAGYKLDVNGTTRVTGTLTVGQIIAGNGTSNLIMQTHVAASSVLTIQYNSANNATSGNKTIATLISTFNPGSGSATHSALDITHTINQTGTASGISRGVYINPTLTSVVDYRAIETTAGKVIIGGSITASSALARGVYFNNTLVAAANNDVLVGLDINPTFTNGAFTGVQNVDLRTKSAGVVIGSGYGYGALYGYANDGLVQITTAANYKTQMWFRPSGNAGGYNSNYWSRIEHDMGTLNIIGSNYGQLLIAANNGGGNGGRIYFTGSTGAANNSLTIDGAANGGRIALTTAASPITLNGGNILIGTSTDAGYKLDVNGTARFSNTIYTNFATPATITAVLARGFSDSSFQLVTENGGSVSGWGISTTFGMIYSGVGDVAKLNFHRGTGTGTGFISFNSPLKIGDTSATAPAAQFTIEGSGSTSATNALYVINSSGARGFQVTDDGTIYTSSTAFVNISFALAVTYDISCRTIAGNSGALGLRGQSFGNASATMVTIQSAGSPASTIGTSLSMTSFSLQSATHVGVTFNGDYTTSVGSNTLIGYNFSPTNYGTATLRAFQSAVGGVYVNTTTYQASAILQADSTTQGFLAPRMTTAQILAITSPAEGLQVYNTDLHVICFYDGTTWKKVSHSHM